MWRRAVVLCLLGLAIAACATDEILDLPGLKTKLGFRQYAGYLPVNTPTTLERSLFYWFFESGNDPDRDPLVLWLNGGPGCSSLIGLLSENGPFWADSQGKSVVLNPFSWNRVANVLFLESPAGVGFSYSLNASDYNTGDDQTAADQYAALLAFLERFPKFAGRAFFVSGESYAGHYIPNLAAKILQENKKAGRTIINLKGLLVGNPWTDPKSDDAGMTDFWYSHQLISKAKYTELSQACSTGDVEACEEALSPVRGSFVPIDVYNVYGDICLERMETPYLRRPISAKKKFSSSSVSESPCIDSYLSAYLNRDDVQVAIHAQREAHGHIKWSMCSSLVNYSDADFYASMLHRYTDDLLPAVGLRILVYSGDTDGVVPTSGTLRWIECLKMTVTVPWTQWKVDGYVGGYKMEFGSSSFIMATVRGAGHMVPGIQPARAYRLFERFVGGAPI